MAYCIEEAAESELSDGVVVDKSWARLVRGADGAFEVESSLGSDKRADIAERKLTQIELIQLFSGALNALVAAEHKIRHEHADVDADVAVAARTYVTMG